MKTNHPLVRCLLLLALATLNTQLSTTFAQGTAFTYQGRLNDGSGPATGIYDLRFAIYDAAGGGNAGGTVTNAATPVTNGLFTITLDFGSGVFTGPARWLEIGVRTNGATAFTTLTSRQPVTPTPYAILAGTANGLAGPLPVSQVSGVVPLAQLPAVLMTNNATGVTLSGNLFGNFGGSFFGNGGGLTGLNPANLSAGTAAINISGSAATANSMSAANISGTLALAQLPAAVVTNRAGNLTLSGAFGGNGVGLTNLQLSAVGPAGTFALLPYYFSPTGNLTVGSRPRNVVTADMNGDGKPDLIVATGTNNTVNSALIVLTNDGSGGFGFHSTLTVGKGCYFAVAADFNNDGKMDLAAANYSDQTVTVHTNDGNDGFGWFATIGIPTNNVSAGPYGLATADINGDGRPDLITANYGDNVLMVLTNNGSGFGINATLAVGTGTRFVLATDVNGDGRADLISADSLTNTLTVLTNNGAGGFGRWATLTVGNNPMGATTADVNGDGKIDIISSAGGDNTLVVQTNNGSGGFGVYAQLQAAGGRSVVTADLNGDGKPDLLSAGWDGTVTVLTNNGNGFGYSATLAVGLNPWGLIAADLNGDGKVDLATANNGETTMSLLLSVPQALSVGNGNTTVLAGHFIGDGSGLTGVNAGPSANFTGLLAGDVTGTQNATVVSAVGGQTAAFVAAGASAANTATSGNVGNAIVRRDAAGNFSAGTITATLSGNATTATTANNISGSLSGDVTGTQNATTVAGVGGQSAANVAAGASAANAATSANTGSTIVKRDASGNFSAGMATFSGNLNLPVTTAGAGVIYSGGSTLIHASGSQSFFAGPGAGNLSMNGVFNNTGVGYLALANSTNGSQNTASGANALHSNTSGSANTAGGVSALYSNTNGSANTASGTGALYNNTSGSANLAGGTDALSANTSGNNNTAGGVDALYNNTSGSGNIALGYQAGYRITTGNDNIDIGNIGTADDTNIIRIGDGQAQTFIAGAINGNGSGLNNLNTTNLTGTFPASRLSGSVNTAVNFTGTLNGDVTGTQGATAVSSVGGSGAANIHTAEQAANAATSAATANAIVKRDAAGNFSAGTITANLAGSATLANNVVAGITITNAFITNSVFAGNGGGLTNLNANNLSSGTVPLAQLPAAVVTNNETGVNISGTFTGNGAGVTNVNAAQLNGLNVSNFWQLGGNNVSSGQFLGSTNNQALEFKVNNVRGLRLEPTVNDANHSNLVNVVGGSLSNSISSGVYGSVIAGGGGFYYGQSPNTISADMSFIGGGQNNSIQTTSDHSFIGGGGYNTIQTNAFFSVLGGGYYNSIQPKTTYSVLGGGSFNSIQTNTSYCVLGGGYYNSIQPNSYDSVVGGGDHNSVQTNAHNSVIGGGSGNVIKHYYGVVMGGVNNTAGGNTNFAGYGFDSGAVVGGGWYNNASGPLSFIGNGDYGTASGVGSVVCGGGITSFAPSYMNAAPNVAAGMSATVPGGANNAALGDFSFAAGYGAQANYKGDFVWADSQVANFNSTANDQFLIRAQGGVGINKANPATALDVNGVVTATSFSGSGAGLTGLNAAQLSGNITNSINFLSAGGVGIGVGNPAHKLVVQADDTGSSADAQQVVIQGDSNANRQLELGYKTSGNFGSIQAVEQLVSYRPLALQPLGGNVGIAKTNPATALDVNGTVTAGSFSGSGAGLTSLNANNISSGTLPPAQLPAVVLTNAATGANAVALGYQTVASSQYAVVSGGARNAATGAGAVVAGGGDGTSGNANTASGPYSAIGGGTQNIASNSRSTVGGGHNNSATNWYATVPGGAWNIAGGTGSFAAGQAARAVHDGSFVWNCDQGNTLSSSAANQFIARASGGYSFYTGTSVGATLAAGSGSWTSMSDRNMKENFAPVDVAAVLQKVAALPLSTWNYKQQTNSIRHLGPMAQDFKAAFTVGETDTGITTVDADGVALAAIQGLNQKLDAKDAEIQDLKQSVAELKLLVQTLIEKK